MRRLGQGQSAWLSADGRGSPHAEWAVQAGTAGIQLGDAQACLAAAQRAWVLAGDPSPAVVSCWLSRSLRILPVAVSGKLSVNSQRAGIL